MNNLLIKKIKAHIAETNNVKTTNGMKYDIGYSCCGDDIMDLIENHETLENANKYDQN